jgi:hypothetical protein
MLSVNGNELSHQDLVILPKCDKYDEDSNKLDGIALWKAGCLPKDKNGNFLILIPDSDKGLFFLENQNGTRSKVTHKQAYNFLRNLV